MRVLLQSRLARLSIVGLLGVVIAAGIAAYQIRAQQTRNAADATQGIAGAPSVGGPFELVTHTGKEVTQADFNDKPKLIYFGFTYCPSICPAELQKMAAALEDLGPDKARQLYPLFITVDPERDTQKVMKDYVTMFHDRLIGLTGTQAQIDKVKEEYKVYASRVDSDKTTGYTMDHSSYIYLMSADNKLVKIFDRSDSAKKVAKGVQSYLESRDG
jgi:protein SCO1/2